jgi:hypothetical protein
MIVFGKNDKKKRKKKPVISSEENVNEFESTSGLLMHGHIVRIRWHVVKGGIVDLKAYKLSKIKKTKNKFIGSPSECQNLTFPMFCPSNERRRSPTIEANIVFPLAEILRHCDPFGPPESLALPKASRAWGTARAGHRQRIGVVVSQVEAPEASVRVAHRTAGYTRVHAGPIGDHRTDGAPPMPKADLKAALSHRRAVDQAEVGEGPVVAQLLLVGQHLDVGKFVSNRANRAKHLFLR